MLCQLHNHPNAGPVIEEVSDENTLTPIPFTDPAPEIIFDRYRFVLTGKFEFGSRSACEQAIVERGGTCSHGVSSKTDVLIVGSTPSPDWMYKTFGKKIEDAVEQQRKGSRLVIVSEQHWRSFL